MVYRTIRKEIFDKVARYDKKRGTNFATMLSQKLNNANDAYTRGVLHGLCLALTQLQVISNVEAIEILEEVAE